MKTKVISPRDYSALKKMAQIVNPLVSKKKSILKKIATLVEEIEGPDGLDAQIAGMEAGIKAKFLGLGTEQLVKKVITPAVREDGTPVLDAKTDKQLTKTTWEPLECLKYNEDNNNYILTVEEDEDKKFDDCNTTTVENEPVDFVESSNGVEQSVEEIDDNPFNF